MKWCFDDPVEAESAAREFIEFCTGRAWVFTDTGTKRGGEKLFQFTHRTFLEYFTAVQLVQTHRTPDEFGLLLHPHIAKREWDIVAQLAFQLKGRGFEGDADALLSQLLAAAKHNSAADWNLVQFAARCLEFMVPTPQMRRDITTECYRRSLEWGLAGSPHLASAPDFGKPSARALGSLLRASTENRTAIADCLKFLTIQSINSSNLDEAVLGAEIGTNLSFAVHGGAETSVQSDVLPFWDAVSREITEKCEGKLALLARKDRNLAFVRVWQRKVTAAEFVECFGIEAAFREIPFILLEGLHISLAGAVIHSVCASLVDKDSVGYLEKNLATAGELGALLMRIPPPWIGPIPEGASSSNLVWGLRANQNRPEVRKYSRHLSKKSNEVFGILLLLAVVSEVSPDDLRRAIATTKNSLLLELAPILSRKVTMTEKSELMTKLRFSTEQQAFVSRWLLSEFKLVGQAQNGAEDVPAQSIQGKANF